MTVADGTLTRVAHFRPIVVILSVASRVYHVVQHAATAHNFTSRYLALIFFKTCQNIKPLGGHM